MVEIHLSPIVLKTSFLPCDLYDLFFVSEAHESHHYGSQWGIQGVGGGWTSLSQSEGEQMDVVKREFAFQNKTTFRV